MSSEYKGIASPCHEAVTDAKGCRSRTIYHKCSRHSGLVQLEELGDHAGCEGGYKHCSKGELLLPALSIVRVLAIAWDEVRGLRRMDCRAVGSTPDPCPMRTGDGSARLSVVYGDDSRFDEEEGEFDVYYDACEAQLHPWASENGGLSCPPDILAQQRKCAMEMMKSAGRNLLKGKMNLISVSMPVKMFEPRSYLEKLTDVWVHTKYLQQAAETEDPVEQMRLIVAWFISGMQFVFLGFKKPFNPILGETWQGISDSGLRIYVEQISHHPPISAFEADMPDGSFVFRGLSEPTASFSGKTVKTTAKGKRGVYFRDGSCIDITYPAYYLRGVLYGELRGELGGSAMFVNEKKGLQCEIKFGPYAEGSTKSFESRSDYFEGEIVPIEPEDHTPRLGENMIISNASGSWLSHLNWDGKRYWTLAEDEPDHFASLPESEFILPSDVRYREDLLFVGQGNLDDAQKAKHRLEKLQRHDKKLRKAHASD